MSNPIHSGFLALLKKIETAINNDNITPEIPNEIRDFLSFDSRLAGINTFLQTYIKHPLAKRYFLDVEMLLKSESLLIKDKINFIQYAFLPIYLELTNETKEQAIQSLFIPSDEPYPLSDELILKVISKNESNYLHQRHQIKKLSEITTNIVNLIISNEMESQLDLDKYDGILSELQANTAKISDIDSNYFKTIVKHIEQILIHKEFSQDDVEYMIGVIAVLSHLSNADFFLLFNEFENPTFTRFLNREKELTFDLFHKFNSVDKLALHKSVIRAISSNLKREIKNLNRDFEKEMQIFEEEQNIDLQIEPIKHKEFINYVLAIFERFSSFNIAYQNYNFNVLHKHLKENATSPKSLLFYLQSLLLIESVFDNDFLKINNYIETHGQPTETKFNLQLTNRYNLPKWINIMSDNVDLNAGTTSNSYDDNSSSNTISNSFTDIIQTQNSHLPESNIDNTFKSVKDLPSLDAFESKVVPITQQIEDNIDDWDNEENLDEFDNTEDTTLDDEYLAEDGIYDDKFNENNDDSELETMENQNNQIKINNTTPYPSLNINVVNEVVQQKTMGDKLDINSIFLKDTCQNDVEQYGDRLVDILEAIIPPSVFEILQQGSDIDMESFNQLHLYYSTVIDEMKKACVKYEHQIFKSIYRHFHTDKGTLTTFRMLLAAELSHKAAYMVNSVDEQERPLTQDEYYFLIHVLQTTATLYLKLYYTYIRKASHFVYLDNEPLENPMAYTANVFAANALLNQVHNRRIPYTPQFRKFINNMGYELINDDVYLIDMSQNSIDKSDLDVSTQSTQLHEDDYKHYVHASDPNDSQAQSNTGGYNIEIHKQPIIIELAPEHYLAHGIFVQSNDGYIVNQRQRVSIQDWVQVCNTVLNETNKIVEYLQIMRGSRIGIDDIQSGIAYNIHNCDNSLNHLFTLCSTNGLHSSAALIADFMTLMDEYRDVNHHTFSVEVRDNNQYIGENQYNNHFIMDELNIPHMVVDPILIDFAWRLSQYLQYLFNHNPLDGLNREDVDLLKYQLHNYTTKCRNTIMMKSLFFSENKRSLQIDNLTKMLSSNLTDMKEMLSDLHSNNSTLMVAAQTQESAVYDMIEYTKEKTNTQTTILNNSSTAISRLYEQLEKLNSMVFSIGALLQSGHKPSKSAPQAKTQPQSTTSNQSTSQAQEKKKFLGLF